MSDAEIERVVDRVNYAHLACSMDDQPYVIPIHYSYQKPDFLFYTTKGKKSDFIDANPKVCLQIEEVVDNSDWKSVIVFGEASRIEDRQAREKAVEAIRVTNPTLTPAISIRWVNNWIRENVEVIYRIKPSRMTGRFSKKVFRKGAIA
ncbi:MAG TPA: pyridoxamine 5'-phosphate oxidase family protein [Pyrinomonadaceae bacterium]